MRLHNIIGCFALGSRFLGFDVWKSTIKNTEVSSEFGNHCTHVLLGPLSTSQSFCPPQAHTHTHTHIYPKIYRRVGSRTGDRRQEKGASPPPKVLFPISPTNISPLFPDVVMQRVRFKRSDTLEGIKKEEQFLLLPYSLSLPSLKERDAPGIKSYRE